MENDDDDNYGEIKHKMIKILCDYCCKDTIPPRSRTNVPVLSVLHNQCISVRGDELIRNTTKFDFCSLNCLREWLSRYGTTY